MKKGKKSGNKKEPGKKIENASPVCYADSPEIRPEYREFEDDIKKGKSKRTH